MRPKTFKLWFTTAVLLILFLIFTLLVLNVDVRPIGPENSEVGFAALNGAFHKATGFSQGWYKATQIAGYLSLVVAAAFAIYAVFQLIMRRSLKKINRSLLCLMCVYVLVGILYVLFEKVIVNYRPVILDAAEGLEASYPSSHTLLAISILGTGIRILPELITKNKKFLRILQTALLLLMLFVVIGRLISGVHWITDILASLILGSSMITLFEAARTTFTEN